MLEPARSTQMETAQDTASAASANPDSAGIAPAKRKRRSGNLLFNIPFLIVGLVVSIAGVLLFQTWETRHGVAQTR